MSALNHLVQALAIIDSQSLDQLSLEDFSAILEKLTQQLKPAQEEVLALLDQVQS